MRPNRGPRPPRVPLVDQLLFVMMAHRDQWFALAEVQVTGRWGAVATALHRRGCEVRKIDGVVYARWTHPLPTQASLRHEMTPVDG